MTDPAPEMTKDGRCSVCQVPAILAGDDQYKICPKCFAMLDHDDLTLAEQQRREKALEVHRIAVLARRAERAAEREIAKKHAVEVVFKKSHKG